MTYTYILDKLIYISTLLFFRSKSGQGISIPYGYSTGFVSGVPVDQSLRQAYPFIMPGQYVTQMPYSPQQVHIKYIIIIINAISDYTFCLQ